MLDLDCKRDEAVSEYKEALAVRDGQQDTRLAAERGVKTAYAVKGHSCDEDADDDAPGCAKPSRRKPQSAGRNPAAPGAAAMPQSRQENSGRHQFNRAGARTFLMNSRIERRIEPSTVVDWIIGAPKRSPTPVKSPQNEQDELIEAHVEARSGRTGSRARAWLCQARAAGARADAPVAGQRAGARGAGGAAGEQGDCRQGRQ
jgi:hypothetical protein